MVGGTRRVFFKNKKEKKIKRTMNNKLAINTYLSTIESKKTNEHTEQKQTHRNREHFDDWQMRDGLGAG